MGILQVAQAANVEDQVRTPQPTYYPTTAKLAELEFRIAFNNQLMVELALRRLEKDLLSGLFRWETLQLTILMVRLTPMTIDLHQHRLDLMIMVILMFLPNAFHLLMMVNLKQNDRRVGVQVVRMVQVVLMVLMVQMGFGVGTGLVLKIYPPLRDPAKVIWMLWNAMWTTRFVIIKVVALVVCPLFCGPLGVRVPPAPTRVPIFPVLTYPIFYLWDHVRSSTVMVFIKVRSARFTARLEWLQWPKEKDFSEVCRWI